MRSFNPLLSGFVLFAACSSDFTDQGPGLDPQVSGEIQSADAPTKVKLTAHQEVDLELIQPDTFDPNTIVVKPFAKSMRMTHRLGQLELRTRHEVQALRAQVVEVPHGVDVKDMVQQLRKTGLYEYVEPNYTVNLNNDAIQLDETDMVELLATGDSSSTDPYAFLQWNLDTLGASSLPENVTGQGITVAVIDTGVATGGNDAPVNILAGYDFINNDADAHDDNGHGTHVAGTIAQATGNNIGVGGVSPDVNILPIKALDAAGSGSYTAIADAIVYAVDNGAQVINMSLGGPVPAAVLADAVSYAEQNGVVIVAATGNDGSDDGVAYPAAYESVIAVGSVGYGENRANYSNAGAELDFAAPGGDMRYDENGDGYPDGILQETIIAGNYNYYFFQGTSMASPHIAASYALLLGTGASLADVDVAMRSSTVDLGSEGWDSVYGHGLAQVDAAYDYLLSMAEPEIEEPLDAMMMRSTNSAVQVRVWPAVDTELKLCLQREDGTEKCRQKMARELTNFRGGQLGISHGGSADFTSFTLGVVSAEGDVYTYGPYDMPQADFQWQDEITCDSDLTLNSVEAKYRSNWGQSGRLVLRLNHDEPLLVRMNGLKKDGSEVSRWIYRAGTASVFGIGAYAGQQDFEFQLRDADGCSVDSEVFTMPTTNQWSLVE